MKVFDKNSKAELQELISSELLFMLSDDFQKKRENTLVGISENHTDYFFASNIIINNNVCYGSLILNRRLDIIENYLDQFRDLFVPMRVTRDSSISCDLFALNLDLTKMNNYDLAFRGFKFESTADGVIEFVKRQREYYFEYYLPFISRFTDISVLNQHVNHNPNSGAGFNKLLGGDGSKFRRLIIAKLANDPIFYEIYEIEKSHFDEYIATSKEGGMSSFYANYPEIFENLFKRLNG